MSYAADVILIFLEYRDLVWSDITASAAGFYAFYYLLEYRILIIIATLTAILATIIANNMTQRFLAIYSIVLNVLLILPLQILIHSVPQEVSVICILILTVPIIACLCYKKFSSKKSPDSLS